MKGDFFKIIYVITVLNREKNEEMMVSLIEKVVERIKKDAFELSD